MSDLLDWVTDTHTAFWGVIVTVIGMYLSLGILTRLAGLRSFSKLSGFDFAVTVAIGSVLAGTILTKDPPLFRGALSLAALFGVQILVAWLRVHVGFIRELTGNTPRLVMANGEVIKSQLRKAKITEADLRSKLREANVLSLSQVAAVVAETTGDVSVLHRSPNDPPLDPALLRGVIGIEHLIQT